MRWQNLKKEHFEKWLTEGSVSIPNLLLQHYKNIGLNEIECFVLIQLHSFIEKGIRFPTPEQLAERMTLSNEECIETISKLIRKGVLLIEEHKDHVNTIYSESYSLTPLWVNLIHSIVAIEQQDSALETQESLYSIFENEFARPLSPIECETLAMWVDEDKHSSELIVAALKEAVLSGKINFRYIDRILFEWKKNGIQTAEEAHKYGERFRSRRQNQNQNKENQDKKAKVSYPFYNWL